MGRLEAAEAPPCMPTTYATGAGGDQIEPPSVINIWHPRRSVSGPGLYGLHCLRPRSGIPLISTPCPLATSSTCGSSSPGATPRSWIHECVAI